MTIIHKGVLYMSGDLIECSIRGAKINKSIIHIEPSAAGSNRCYICHNDDRFRGSTSPEKYGFAYSWQFNATSESTNADVQLLGNLSKESKIGLRKSISPKLMNFIRTQSFNYLYTLFALKLYLPEYLDIDISTNKGMILLKNDSGREMEIKVGRHITQSLILFNKISGRNITISQDSIEKLSNNYIAYQTNNLIQFTYLSGEELVMGYNTNKYLEGYNTSPIFKSCMNNKFDFISLYVKNPDSVRLLIAKMNGRIIGRSLVWNLCNGDLGMDRIYYISDWIKPLFEDYAKENNIKTKENMHATSTVQLKDIDLKHYPYMDTFHYLTKDGLLCREVQHKDTDQKKITRVDGSFYEVN